MKVNKSDLKKFSGTTVLGFLKVAVLDTFALAL